MKDIKKLKICMIISTVIVFIWLGVLTFLVVDHANYTEELNKSEAEIHSFMIGEINRLHERVEILENK